MLPISVRPTAGENVEELELACTAAGTEAKGGSTNSGDCLEVSAHVDHHELAHMEHTSYNMTIHVRIPGPKGRTAHELTALQPPPALTFTSSVQQ